VLLIALFGSAQICISSSNSLISTVGGGSTRQQMSALDLSKFSGKKWSEIEEDIDALCFNDGIRGGRTCRNILMC